MNTFQQEQVLYKTHPAMFGKHPILFSISMALVLAYGLGLIILMIWWIRVSCQTLIITSKRVIYKKGFFSKDEMEIPHSQIGIIQIHKGFWENIFGVGTIAIAATGTSGFELTLDGMPDPGRIKRIIDANQF
jgi:uncharacterized membrane protein YdbT with pleckstrin-like domain